MSKKHTIKPLNEYLGVEDEFINEEFYNPFDQANEIDVKPSHIADKGGMFKLRKEIFNINRAEYTKKNNGSYMVVAKTQFAKGEIIEIAPVIFVGPEAKAVPRLKDYIFEIDSAQQIYGVVLGYGSLYGHSETPNVTFAYNKGNRQMYFISAQTISAGKELTINYGKDYWSERSGFGTMAQQDPTSTVDAIAKTADVDESSVQPNAEDITNMSMTKQFGAPNSRANPAVSGVAIVGVGQS